MNKLEIRLLEFCYQIAGKPGLLFCNQAEFFVDGVALSHQLGFAAQRPWLGRTFFDQQNPPPDLVGQFLGQAPAQNQFGTGRLVLYGCHCGCDYCGIFSCHVQQQDHLIYWRDIRYEDDMGSVPADPPLPPQEHMASIPQLVFELTQYQQAVSDFLQSKNPF